MKEFDYASPRTETEAVALLSPERGESEILAGGTDLVPLMKKMVVSPRLVVSLNQVEGMRSIEGSPFAGIQVGNGCTLDEILDSSLLEAYPGIGDVIRNISSIQLQAQGTLGGELCQRPQCWYFRGGHGLLADNGRLVEEGDNRYHAIIGNTGPAKFVSASRLAPVLIALGAEIRVVGPGNENGRTMPLADLYRTPRHEGQRELTLEPNEIVTHVMLPAMDSLELRSATYEVRHGAGPEYPLAAAACVLKLQHGVVEAADIVMGQVAPVPWRCQAAAKVLVGKRIDEFVAQEAANASLSKATPLSKNAYKVKLARVAIKRAILKAAGLETGGF